MTSDNDIIVKCSCGNMWFMDYEPAPEECEGMIWKLGVVEWGAWVDHEGNPIGP